MIQNGKDVIVTEQINQFFRPDGSMISIPVKPAAF